MHTALEHMVDALEREPGTPLHGVEVLPEAERHRVVTEWNQTAVACPAARCVHELVEEQARMRPDALAAAGAGQELTYRELDERAAALAELLRRQGVQPESLVAVCLERSIEMLIAALAVWKAGNQHLDRALQ